MTATHATVEETAGGGALAWHTAPVRQLVVTLSGTLIFTTRDGEEFTLRPGDVLLAEDTAGSGHQWRLEGSDPCGACMWCSHPTPRFRSSGTESLGDPRLCGFDERLHGRQPGIGLRREHDVPGRKGLESRTGY